MGAANVADGNGAAFIAVDAERMGKAPALIGGANVKDIAVPRIALVVNHVEEAFAVHDNLRLDAAVGNAEAFHLAFMFLCRRLPVGLSETSRPHYQKNRG
jgi:hypothetical protein